MLLKLTISNYALIKEVTIDFSGGFTVITGETGAGKSIILGAINILIGGRASVKLLENKERKSIIEGVFRSNQIEPDQLKGGSKDVQQHYLF